MAWGCAVRWALAQSKAPALCENARRAAHCLSLPNQGIPPAFQGGAQG